MSDEFVSLFDFHPEERANPPTLPGTQIDAIDRESPLPLYHQLYLILLRKIQQKEWHPDEAISTEKELSQNYQISRATVRQAIQQLVDEGYLYRRHGLGTFVCKPRVRHGPQRPFGLTGYLRAHGLEPGWRLLNMEPVAPPSKVVDALGMRQDEQALRILRLRLADQEVIGVHTCYIPYPLAEQIQPEHMEVGEDSLYYLKHFLHISVSETHRTLQAISADEEDSKLLKVSETTPLLLINRLVIDPERGPVEHLRAVYRGDRFEYYVHLEH
jgi:GntR family transcriptional regulator